MEIGVNVRGLRDSVPIGMMEREKLLWFGESLAVVEVGNVRSLVSSVVSLEDKKINDKLQNEK